jgi:thymidine kinase
MSEPIDDLFEIIFGCMFSRKTGMLIEYFLKDLRQKIALKPDIDTRHQDERIHSREGSSIEAIRVQNSDLNVFELDTKGLQVIYIDEFQFFKGIAAFVLKMNSLNIAVICAGLDEDSSKVQWTAFVELNKIPHKKLTHLHASCHACGRDAHHTMRLIPTSSLIVIGDKKIYQPACSDCHKIVV